MILKLSTAGFGRFLCLWYQKLCLGTDRSVRLRNLLGGKSVSPNMEKVQQKLTLFPCRRKFTYGLWVKPQVF